MSNGNLFVCGLFIKVLISLARFHVSSSRGSKTMCFYVRKVVVSWQTISASDRILIKPDAMDVKTFEQQTIPDADTAINLST